MSLTIIGWLATTVFASSYFFRRPLTLRRIQAGAALLWVMYGIAIDAVPVVVANLIVAGADSIPRSRRVGQRATNLAGPDLARSGLSLLSDQSVP